MELTSLAACMSSPGVLQSFLSVIKSESCWVPENPLRTSLTAVPLRI